LAETNALVVLEDLKTLTDSNVNPPQRCRHKLRNRLPAKPVKHCCPDEKPENNVMANEEFLRRTATASANILAMSADTPGRRLKVLTAGLLQLTAGCVSFGGELSADAAPSVVAASPWQTNVDQHQGQTHRDFIRHQVAHLVANDRYITSQLKETTANFGNLTSEESPGTIHFRPLSRFTSPNTVLIWCNDHMYAWVCTKYFPDGGHLTYNSPTDQSGVGPH
jgi:hypothetical protein